MAKLVPNNIDAAYRIYELAKYLEMLLAWLRRLLRGCIVTVVKYTLVLARSTY